VPVSDLEMAVLRGATAGDAETARRAFSEQLAQSGDASGLAMLAYAALVIAARRTFAPQYTRADLIGYVARLRAGSTEPGLMDPRTAEDELRGALGEQVSATHEIGAIAAARLFLLLALIETLELDDEAIEDLVAEARYGADQLLEHVSP
jgi:hypothetical protein